MSELAFDWNNQKAKVNERKHGVSFKATKQEIKQYRSFLL
jgi:uncharacterized DUF497 family protein